MTAGCRDLSPHGSIASPTLEHQHTDHQTDEARCPNVNPAQYEVDQDGRADKRPNESPQSAQRWPRWPRDVGRIASRTHPVILPVAGAAWRPGLEPRRRPRHVHMPGGSPARADPVHFGTNPAREMEVSEAALVQCSVACAIALRKADDRLDAPGRADGRRGACAPRP